MNTALLQNIISIGSLPVRSLRHILGNPANSRTQLIWYMFDGFHPLIVSVLNSPRSIHVIEQRLVFALQLKMSMTSHIRNAAYGIQAGLWVCFAPELIRIPLFPDATPSHFNYIADCALDRTRRDRWLKNTPLPYTLIYSWKISVLIFSEANCVASCFDVIYIPL